MLKKIAITILVLSMLGAGVFVYWLNWVGSDAEVVAIVNSVEVPKDWELKSTRSEPPRNLCLNSVPCPSASRIYDYDKVADAKDLAQGLVKDGIHDISYSKDCDDKSSPEYCEVSRDAGKGYRLIVIVSSDHEKNRTHIIISAER